MDNYLVLVPWYHGESCHGACWREVTHKIMPHTRAKVVVHVCGQQPHLYIVYTTSMKRNSTSTVTLSTHAPKSLLRLNKMAPYFPEQKDYKADWRINHCFSLPEAHLQFIPRTGTVVPQSGQHNTFYERRKNCELQRVTMITQLHSSTVASPVHTTTTSNWQTEEQNATLLCFLTRKASQRG